MKLVASFLFGSLFCVACGSSFTTSQDAGNDGAGGDDNATGGATSGGDTGGSTSSGGDSATGGATNATGGADSGTGGNGDCELGSNGCDAVQCDPALITCQPIVPPPDCPQGQAYSVKDGCYGECVDMDRCSCSQTVSCPNPNEYTCHLFRGRCGPYLR